LRGGVKDDQPSLVAGFSPTSRENLMAASRIALGSAPLAEPRATRVSTSPDPRMAGRLVYTVAIQMPNVTSFSGSWIVWFAVREEGTANDPAGPALAIRPPVPLRKVDPKYIQSAVSDRVEGKVLLRAVIRKDGHVESVVLLRGIDERLDRSAEEALAKWAFEPAMRDGLPVDVDAVFEIPFRLAPKPIK
jgi:protein TonB